MSPEAPQPTQPQRESFWHRFTAAVRYVLDLEPVVVVAIFRAAIVVLTSTGLAISDTVDARGVAIIGAVYGLTELLGTLRQRSQVAPWSTVVEQAVDGRVISGPASELPTGTDVRATGSLDEGLYRT